MFCSCSVNTKESLFLSKQKVLYDSGRDWKYLTTFGLRFESASEDSKSSLEKWGFKLFG